MKKWFAQRKKHLNATLCVMSFALLSGCIETDREYADRVCRMAGHPYGTPQYSQCYQAAFGQAQAQSNAMIRTGSSMMSSPQPRPPVICRQLGNTMTCQ